MGLYQTDGFVVEPPESSAKGPTTPTPNTLHEAAAYLLIDLVPGEGLWCGDRMWRDHTAHHDFRGHEPIGSLRVLHFSSQLA